MPGGHWQQIPKTLNTTVICGAQSQAPLCGRGSLRVSEFELMVALLLSMVCQVCLLSGRELMIRMNCGRSQQRQKKEKLRSLVNFLLTQFVFTDSFIRNSIQQTLPSWMSLTVLASEIHHCINQSFPSLSLEIIASPSSTFFIMSLGPRSVVSSFLPLHPLTFC